MPTRQPRSGGAQGVVGRGNTQRSGAAGPHTHGNAARHVVDGGRRCVGSENRQTTPQQPATTSNNQRQPAQPQYAHYRAPLTHKWHPQQPRQPQYTNYWALRTPKQQQQEHRLQRPTKRSHPTKGRTFYCPGPRQETATQRNVTQGGGMDNLTTGNDSIMLHMSTCPYGCCSCSHCWCTTQRYSATMHGQRYVLHDTASPLPPFLLKHQLRHQLWLVVGQA